MLSLYEVKGNSMLPSLNSGDFVFANQFYFVVRVNDVVVVNHPYYHRIIKRVARICQIRGFLLCGDHEDSVSSKKMGWVTQPQIEGKVMFSIRKR